MINKKSMIIYFKIMVLNLKTLMYFKSDFYIMLISGILTEALGFVFVWVLYQRIPDINGWTMWEIIFMYAMVYISTGICTVFYNGLWGLSSVVNHGEFDKVLLRPVSPLVQVFSMSIGINGIGNILLGIVLLIQSLVNLNISWSLLKISGFILVFISAVMIQISINLLASSTIFWMKSRGNPILTFITNMTEFSKYPINIFSVTIKVVIIIIIPIAFIGYYPATFLINNNFWIALISPLISIYVLLLSIYVFYKGILRYESAGG